MYWEEPRPDEYGGAHFKFDGTPCIIVTTKILECQHGKDRHSAKKQRTELMKLAQVSSTLLYILGVVYYIYYIENVMASLKIHPKQTSLDNC